MPAGGPRNGSEWGVVETKLQIIEREDLGPQLAQLGAGPILKHLRQVHARYGEVTGATKVAQAPQSPQLREKYDALLASIRHYVGAVTGSVQRRKPETRELADTLLKPLVEWKSPKARKQAAPKGDEPTGGAPAGSGGAPAGSGGATP